MFSSPVAPHPVSPADTVADVFGSAGEPGICVAHLDRTLAIRHANPEFFRRFGRSSAQLCGRRFADLIHPSVQTVIMRNFVRLLEGTHQRFASRLVAVSPGDEPITGTLTGMAVQGGGPGAVGVLVLMRPNGRAAVADSVVIGRRKILSPIDAKILEGIAAGLSTIPLASRLHLSRQGVEYHVSGLLRKLKVPNRAALVSRAYSMGVLDVGVWPPKVVEDFIK